MVQTGIYYETPVHAKFSEKPIPLCSTGQEQPLGGTHPISIWGTQESRENLRKQPN